MAHEDLSPGYVAGKLHTAATLANVGIIRPQRPDRLVGAALALVRWGATPAAGYKAAAARFPDDLCVIDESGTLTFKEVHQRTNALAHALADEGVQPGDGVAIMCRNHRGWVEAYVAVNKLGANALFMNTSFSGPQLADVADREDPVAVIFDEEFAEVLAGGDGGAQALRRVARAGRRPRRRDARRLSSSRRPTDLRPPPARQGDPPHLGHDGHAEGREPHAAAVARPRGRAARADPAARAREDDDRRAAVPRLGLRALHARHGPLSTVVLQRRFDPEATLSLTARTSARRSSWCR